MRHLIPFAVWIFVAATAATTPVAAQQTDPQQPEEIDLAGIEVLGDELWLVSTSATSTTMAGAVALFSVQLATSRSRRLVAFIRHNGLELQRDLHVGGGEAIRDLGALFSIPVEQLDSFARELYRRRHRLVPLADPDEIDAARSRRFADLVLGGLAISSEEINSPVPFVVSSDPAIGRMPHRAEELR